MPISTEKDLKMEESGEHDFRLSKIIYIIIKL